MPIPESVSSIAGVPAGPHGHHSHAVVSREQWIAARKRLLEREKELTRQAAELARARRELPWQRVDKAYAFETPEGPRSLEELFAGKSQLVVYHFMFAPEWEQGCPSCSFWADNFDGTEAHLAARDVRFTAVSRAPLPKLTAYAQRLGWSFPWASSHGNDFNFDFGVSFRPEDYAAGQPSYNYEPLAGKHTEREGLSVFYKEACGTVFHTYSCYARGIDALNTAYQVLDLVPRGRDEGGLSYPMAWVKRHDEYPR
jgi:predicted dithiol-disulfide oxidoreductase (DUF899 family)